MKNKLRKIAIVIWVLYVVVGIVCCIAGVIPLGIIFALPAALGLVLVIEKKPKKLVKENHPTETKPSAHLSAPPPAPTPICTAGQTGYAPIGSTKRLNVPCYIVLDVETTGFSDKNDQIIEVAALKIVDDQIVDRYESMVNPHRSIPAHIEKLTGISDDDLKNAPDIKTVVQALAQFLSPNYPIVGHNVCFDVKFIAAAFSAAGVDWDFRYIDTLRLSQEAFPNLQNHKLNTLISELQLLDHEQLHRAMSDVEATHQLYLRCKTVLNMEDDSNEDFLNDNEDDEVDPGFDLNKRGMDYEAKGDIENAIDFYEKSVAANFCGSHPYQRLCVLYRKQHKFEDEIRICDAALSILHGSPQSASKEDYFYRRKLVAQEKLSRTETAAKPNRPSGFRPVIQMDDTGAVIAEFESASAASVALHINAKSIREAAKGTQRHAGGYCWAYKKPAPVESE